MLGPSVHTLDTQFAELCAQEGQETAEGYARTCWDMGSQWIEYASFRERLTYYVFCLKHWLAVPSQGAAT